MGFLRVYLALCVVAAHSNFVLPYAMHDGTQAVQIFFMISGFYMAMTLTERYSSVREFYASRWLRIFVPYYLILVFTFIICVIYGVFRHDWLKLIPYLSHPLSRNGLAGFLIAALSNVTLFFQDWVMFLQHDRGTALSFTLNFEAHRSPLYYYLMIPQCWSVGVELTFYLLAPFLNKMRSRTLLIIIALSFSVRVFAYFKLGLQHDPWTYRFFPFELALFLAGMLAYRAYKRFEFTRRFPLCLKGSS